MRYYLATASDGTVLTRSSQNRTYTHCVARCHIVRAATPEEIEQNKNRLWFDPEASTRWFDSWAGSHALAQSAARGQHRYVDPRVTYKLEILEAVEIDRAGYEAIKKAQREIQDA